MPTAWSGLGGMLAGTNSDQTTFWWRCTTSDCSVSTSGSAWTYQIVVSFAATTNEDEFVSIYQHQIPFTYVVNACELVDYKLMFNNLFVTDNQVFSFDYITEFVPDTTTTTSDF